MITIELNEEYTDKKLMKREWLVIHKRGSSFMSVDFLYLSDEDIKELKKRVNEILP